MGARSAQHDRATATRLLGELGAQYLAGRGRGDLPGTLSVYQQGAAMARQHALTLDWVVDACADLVEGGMWEGLTSESVDAGGGAFQRGVVGIVLRRHGDLAASQRALEEALRDGSLLEPERRFLTLHHAHVLRNSGRYRDAEAAYRVLAEDLDRVGLAARIQMADLEMLRGRFDAAVAAVDLELPSVGSELEARRLAGHVFRFNARWSQAEERYREVLERSRAVSAAAFEGKALTNLAETYCWFRPGEAVAIARQAVEVNTTLGNRMELVKAHAALAAALLVNGDRAGAQAARLQSLEWVRATGYRAGRLFTLMVDVLRGISEGDQDTARAARREASGLSEELGAYPYLPMIMGWWLGETVSQDPPIAWLDRAPEVRGRWRGVLGLVSR